MKMNSYDIISRLFKKQRSSGFFVEYPFTTHSWVFEKHDDDVLNKIAKFSRDVFLYGYEKRDLGCSDASRCIIDIEEVCNDLIFHTMKSEYKGHGFKQHDVVQNHFLHNDKFFICYEMPVWDNERQGFIDLVRYKDGRVQIADFKPSAAKEKKAATQVAYNVKLFSERTNIPLDFIDGFYFDEKNCYKIIF